MDQNNIPGYPGALTGTIAAIESIKDSVVVLNGPTGCKYFHGRISNQAFPRNFSMNPSDFPKEFFLNQPRVPTTYLNGEDYIFGPGHKLIKSLAF